MGSSKKTSSSTVEEFKIGQHPWLYAKPVPFGLSNDGTKRQTDGHGENLSQDRNDRVESDAVGESGQRRVIVVSENNVDADEGSNSKDAGAKFLKPLTQEMRKSRSFTRSYICGLWKKRVLVLCLRP